MTHKWGTLLDLPSSPLFRAIGLHMWHMVFTENMCESVCGVCKTAGGGGCEAKCDVCCPAIYRQGVCVVLAKTT